MRAPLPLRLPLRLRLLLCALLALVPSALGDTPIAVDPLGGGSAVTRLNDNKGFAYVRANNSAGVGNGFASALCPAGATFSRYQCTGSATWNNNPVNAKQGAHTNYRSQSSGSALLSARPFCSPQGRGTGATTCRPRCRPLTPRTRR